MAYREASLIHVVKKEREGCEEPRICHLYNAVVQKPFDFTPTPTLPLTAGLAGNGFDGPGIESRWEARFSAPVQTGPGAHPASCTVGTGSFIGGKAAGTWR